MAADPDKKSILLITASGSFLAPFMVSSLIVAIPAIGREFSMSAVEMSQLATAFFLAASMFLVPFGRAADILGVKRIFTAGIYIYLFSALLAAFAPSSLILIGARFLTGVGAAMIFGTSFALLSLTLPQSERGQALGINISASLLGFALGFQIGGLLTYYVNWRGFFLLTLPIDLLVIALLRLKLPVECALSKGQKLDLPGSALIAVMLFAIVAGFSELPGLEGALLLIAGLIFFIVFARREWHSKSPIIDMRLLSKNRPFALANGAVLAYNAGSFGVIFLFSLYLQYILEFDTRQVGLVLLVFTLIMAALVSFAGRLSDRFRPYLIASMGILITLLGLLLLFMIISPVMPLTEALIGFLLIVIGGALFPPPMVKTVLSCIPREMYGLGGSLAEMMRLLGNTMSMAFISIAFAHFLRGNAITPENYTNLISSMRAIFVIFSLFMAATLLMIFWYAYLKRRRNGITCE
ncbi:MAG: MFS transporter [Methanotrichaceae archaeon]